MTKSKATEAVKTFFSDFQEAHACKAGRWGRLCSAMREKLYVSWFHKLHALPTMEEIDAKFVQCQEEVLKALCDGMSMGTATEAAASSSLSPGELRLQSGAV